MPRPEVRPVARQMVVGGGLALLTSRCGALTLRVTHLRSCLAPSNHQVVRLHLRKPRAPKIGWGGSGSLVPRQMVVGGGLALLTSRCGALTLRVTHLRSCLAPSNHQAVRLHLRKPRAPKLGWVASATLAARQMVVGGGFEPP